MMMQLKPRWPAAALFALLCIQAPAHAQTKPVARLPFENRNGSIVLTVQLNDFPRPLKLLFDTGADGIAMGQALADSAGLKSTSANKVSVVGGTMDIAVSAGNNLKIAGFSLVNQNVAIFKELHKIGTDGVIGNLLIKHYIFKVDYDREEILLYKFGEFEETGAAMIPVTTPNGMIIIPGTLNITPEQPHAGNFVFDTGASYDLICFRPFVRKNKLLVSGFKPEQSGGTISMGMHTPTFTGKAAAFSLPHLPPVKNMPVTLMAGNGQNEDWNPGVDGSIGVGLIGRYNFTIDMQRKTIYVTPNQSHQHEKN